MQFMRWPGHVMRGTNSVVPPVVRTLVAHIMCVGICQELMGYTYLRGCFGESAYPTGVEQDQIALGGDGAGLPFCGAHDRMRCCFPFMSITCGCRKQDTPDFLWQLHRKELSRRGSWVGRFIRQVC